MRCPTRFNSGATSLPDLHQRPTPRNKHIYIYIYICMYKCPRPYMYGTKIGYKIKNSLKNVQKLFAIFEKILPKIWVKNQVRTKDTRDKSGHTPK